MMRMERGERWDDYDCTVAQHHTAKVKAQIFKLKNSSKKKKEKLLWFYYLNIKPKSTPEQWMIGK